MVIRLSIMNIRRVESRQIDVAAALPPRQIALRWFSVREFPRGVREGLEACAANV